MAAAARWPLLTTEARLSRAQRTSPPVIDEVFADHYLDVVKAAALLRLPPTLTEGLARIPTEGPLARSSACASVEIVTSARRVIRF
jgi:hypothetical protein